MLITEQIYQSASKNIHHPAFLSLKEEISYQDFFSLISQLSSSYQKEIGHQMRVAILSKNSPEMAASFLALCQLRCVSTIIDPELSTDEILEWLNTSKCSHLIVSEDQKKKAEELLKKTQLPLQRIEMKKGSQEKQKSPLFSPDPNHIPHDTDPILLIRTAGHTGSHKYILFNHQQINDSIRLIKDFYRFTTEDRVLTHLSWSHPFALTHALLLPIHSNITCVMNQDLKNELLLEFLLTSKVTRLIDTPQFFFKLLLAQSKTKTLISTLRSVTVGMGFLSLELRKTFNLLNVFVCQVYGQAEALWTIAMEICPSGDAKTSQRTEVSRGFVGSALPGVKYKVFDFKGRETELKGSVQGALAISGSMIMKRYENLEKESRSTLRGAWLHTGDVVKIQRVGTETYLNYLGRLSEFEYSDFKFEAISRIDQILRNIPFLKDCASFFMKNSIGDLTLLIAAVKVHSKEISEQQILEYCKKELPQDIVPQNVVFIDEIPRDEGGNPHYQQLRAKLASMT